MKNLFLLPTDKPSRLYKSKITQNIFISNIISQYGDATYNQHIYITSDEEIKEDDYYLGDDNHIYCLVTTVNSNGKKIILTTDQDLIKDGVQAIDDEFLEWFVKNPTYEEVYIIKQYKQVNQDNPLHKGSTALRFSHYEIHLLKATKQMIDEWNLIYCKLNSRQIPTEEEQTKCYCGNTNYCDCKPEELELTQLKLLEVPNPSEFMQLGEKAFKENVHEKLRETLSPNEKQMWISGYLLALTQQNKK